MTGSERIEAAFSAGGASVPAAVVAYYSLLVRDRALEIVRPPWWWSHAPDEERRLARLGAEIETFGLDWILIPIDPPRSQRQGQLIEADGRVHFHPADGGAPREIAPPQKGGTASSLGRDATPDLDALPDDDDAIDRLVPPLAQTFDRQAFLASGGADVAHALAKRFPGKARIMHVGSTLWSIWSLFGYEAAMTMLARHPLLMRRACENKLTHQLANVERLAAAGVQVVWIEECLSDQFSPATYREVTLPPLRTLIQTIRRHGMRSVYYYCGNPWDRFEDILSAGADALSLEEGKKGFTIDIAEVLKRVDGRCAVLGNLDAIGMLQDADSATLRREIERQWNAARQHGGRFIMSTGSPVTPDTPTRRVREYVENIRQLDARQAGGCGLSDVQANGSADEHRQ